MYGEGEREKAEGRKGILEVADLRVLVSWNQKGFSGWTYCLRP